MADFSTAQASFQEQNTTTHTHTHTHIHIHSPCSLPSIRNRENQTIRVKLQRISQDTLPTLRLPLSDFRPSICLPFPQTKLFSSGEMTESGQGNFVCWDKNVKLAQGIWEQLGRLSLFLASPCCVHRAGSYHPFLRCDWLYVDHLKAATQVHAQLACSHLKTTKVWRKRLHAVHRPRPPINARCVLVTWKMQLVSSRTSWSRSSTQQMLKAPSGCRAEMSPHWGVVLHHCHTSK